MSFPSLSVIVYMWQFVLFISNTIRLLGWQLPASLLLFSLYPWQSKINVLTLPGNSPSHSTICLLEMEHTKISYKCIHAGTRTYMQTAPLVLSGLGRPGRVWKWACLTLQSFSQKGWRQQDDGPDHPVSSKSAAPMPQLIYAAASLLLCVQHCIYLWTFSLHTLWGKDLYHVQEL